MRVLLVNSILIACMGGSGFVKFATQMREHTQDRQESYLKVRTGRAMKHRGAANKIQWLDMKCHDVRSCEQIELLIKGKVERWLERRVLNA